MTDIFASVRGRRRAPAIFPAAPLIEAAREPSDARLMARLGVGGYTWATAKREGLTDAQADRWAIRCGFHPSELWTDWFDHAPAWDDDTLDAALEGAA